MNNFNALDILQVCINELNSTTKEQFDNKRKELGIYNKAYNREEYINDEVEIVFDLDDKINIQQNDFICEYESEFINSLLLQDDEYNTFNQISNIEMETSFSINCKEHNITALAA